MNLRAEIVILNYNGRDILERYLPSFCQALQKSRFNCRLSVLDNQSQDDSVAFLRRAFPDVQVYIAPENRVLCSYNDLARSLDAEILIFMNNDILVDADFIDPLIEPFLDDADIFFVTPRCLSLLDKRYEGNKTRGFIRHGLYWSSAIYPGHEREIDKAGLTLQGGFGAVDRKKFLELGGYDDLYLPGRLEDADLCFWAYKKGWRCLYEPRSVVYHEGGVSFKRRFGMRKTLVVNWRNTFLFMWKNISDKILIFRFFMWLPVRLLVSLATGKPELFLGFWQALPLYSKARERRHAMQKKIDPTRISDQEIFSKV